MIKNITLFLFATLMSFFMTGCGDNVIENTTTKEHKDMEKNQTSALISRKKLFGNPDYANVKISPDGKYLSYLAPKDGVLNIYLAKVEDIDNAKAITSDKNRGIRSYFWAFNSSTIIYSQDENGDENARLYKIDVEANKITPLTPQGVKAFAIALSHNFPNHLLVSMNDRDPKFFDVYKLDINNATMERVLKNEKYTDFVADKNLKLRFAMYITPNGDTDIFNIDDIANPKLYKNIKSIDSANSEILFFANDNEFYLLDSQNRDTAALYKETTEGKRDLVAQNDKADISYISLHPTNYTQQYYSYEYQRTSKVFFDKTVEADFEFLKNASETESDIDIISRTLDDNMWVVIFDSSDRPASYYLFNRSAKKLDFLFYTRKNLVEENLTYMIPVIIKSRDGLDLPSYLSLPREVFTKPDNPHNKLSKKPVPMVLFVHGGPQARDFWGFDSTHQWLANRGYAVLSVNYRGSDGFGKNFIELGNGEWGGKMHLDLIDAVNWAIENNIALKDKIGIYGGSYGGYSALVGATFTPDVFACAADVVGPSNLITLLNSLPEYWIPAISKLIQKTGGDPSTEEGRKFLAQRSPINFVDNIKKPLLIAQGANDPRVKEAESTQIVKKMQEKKIQVTYLLYSDEGHGFARPENRMSFTALLEQFFAKHLGGRFEALGDELNNSSIKIVDKGGLEIEVENK